MKDLVRSVLATSLLFLGLCGPIQAQQTVRTNDVPLAWTTVTAGVNSNITTWGNSGGYAAANALKMQPSALGMNCTVSFSCATVTLAAATCVLQGSVDGLNWHNVPGANGAFNVSVPASASSANNTNVVYSTNFTQAQLGQFIYWRVPSTTNGNAANLTGLRVTLGAY